MTESWRTTFRNGFAPQLSRPALEALRLALASDSVALVQGVCTVPSSLPCVSDWPVEAACAIGYCGWAEIEATLNGELDSVKPNGALEITLTQGKVAWVDADDYAALSSYNWWALNHHGNWYAYRTEYIGGEGYEQHNILMHRQIMAAPDGMVVDHADRNGLNNTRGNLRLMTDAENKRNCRRSGKSIFRGVYPSPTDGRWCAKMSVSGKSVYLGTFGTEREAAHAHNEAVWKQFGDKAVLNRFATVAEVEEFFARMCSECDQRLGEPAGCRWFLNFFDETPRQEMRRELLAEVQLALAGREPVDAVA